jgi:hypothetical protein
MTESSEQKAVSSKRPERKSMIIRILAHRVIEWVKFSDHTGSKLHGNWL